MKLPTIEIKAGESYSQHGALADAAGDPIDLTGYTATSQVRTVDGDLVGALTVTIDTGSGGTMEIAASATETATWAPGSYVADIRFAAPGGAVVPSPTFGVRVLARITETA